MSRVFVSYSMADKEDISSVIRRVTKRVPELEGAEVWDPSTGLSVGDDFRAEVKKQIQAADVMLLVWSKNSATSPWVNYEVGMADAQEKRIVVALEPGSPPLPGILSAYQAIELEEES